MSTPYSKSGGGVISSAKRTRKRPPTPAPADGSVTLNPAPKPGKRLRRTDNNLSNSNTSEHAHTDTHAEAQQGSQSSDSVHDSSGTASHSGHHERDNKALFSPTLHKHHAEEPEGEHTHNIEQAQQGKDKTVTHKGKKRKQQQQQQVAPVSTAPEPGSSDMHDASSNDDTSSSSSSSGGDTQSAHKDAHADVSADAGGVTAHGVTANGVTQQAAPASDAHIVRASEVVGAVSEEDAAAATAATEQEAQELEEEDFDPYQFMRHLPPYDTVKDRRPVIPELPQSRATRRSARKATLVLDLDETLVHCTVEPIPNPDHMFKVRFNDEDFSVYVRKRPGLDAFLKSVSALFEVVIFTASQQVYAETLLNMLDPQGRHIAHRLYRDACLQVEGNYLKDLNVLGRDLKRVAIVDNSPYAYGYQIENGIPIESWFDDPEDTELEQLLPLLRKLADKDDVRPTIQQTFKTHELIRQAKPLE